MPWRLVDPEHTRTFDGDGAAMVFNPVSWATHRVAPLVLWVIEQLRQHARSQGQLLEELCLNGEDRSTLEVHLAAAITELERYGIITRAPISDNR